LVWVRAGSEKARTRRERKKRRIGSLLEIHS
jgi:hypothetical protein